MSIVTSAVEVGLVCILEVVLDVAHLVVHCDEVLLVHPEQQNWFLFQFCLNLLFICCKSQPPYCSFFTLELLSLSPCHKATSLVFCRNVSFLIQRSVALGLILLGQFGFKRTLPLQMFWLSLTNRDCIRQQDPNTNFDTVRWYVFSNLSHWIWIIYKSFT